MKQPVKLTLDEWNRVLTEAQKLARALEDRRGVLEREYQGLEANSTLEQRLASARSEGRTYLRDRIEVHIGTIQVLRPTRPRNLPLVPIPESVERKISDLVGPESARSLVEVETWRR